jgi:hypothetical protein
MFKKVFKMKSKPVNFNEYPFRVIEIDRSSSFPTRNVLGGSNKSRMSFASNIEDDDSQLVEDESVYSLQDDEMIEDESYESGSFWSEYSDSDDDLICSHHEDESESYLQQFDQIDFARTDWNSYDLNRIVF